MTPSPVEFLTARYDEREALARTATRGPWTASRGPGEDLHLGRMDFTTLDAPSRNLLAVAGLPLADARHMALHDPPRVLEDLDTKRQLVELHGPDGYFGDCCSSCGDVPQVPYPCDTLRLLIGEFATHPDYDPAWNLP